jgi:large subunit ribosomal protein L32
MAVPKRKSSKARGRKRRTHDSLTSPGLSVCPSCGEPKLAHRVCPHCGTYNGREIVAEETDKE